jgi:hypothetical protein
MGQIITAVRIAMNILVKNDLEMNNIGTTVTTAAGMIVHHSAATAPSLRLLVAPIMMIVAPGLRPLGGRMIEGLQGMIVTVMIGGEVIMTRRLIMIMTDAGMIMTDPVLGKTEDATRRMGVPLTTGPPGTEMATSSARRQQPPPTRPDPLNVFALSYRLPQHRIPSHISILQFIAYATCGKLHSLKVIHSNKCWSIVGQGMFQL